MYFLVIQELVIFPFGVSTVGIILFYKEFTAITVINYSFDTDHTISVLHCILKTIGSENIMDTYMYILYI